MDNLVDLRLIYLKCFVFTASVEKIWEKKRIQPVQIVNQFYWPLNIHSLVQTTFPPSTFKTEANRSKRQATAPNNQWLKKSDSENRVRVWKAGNKADLTLKQSCCSDFVRVVMKSGKWTFNSKLLQRWHFKASDSLKLQREKKKTRFDLFTELVPAGSVKLWDRIVKSSKQTSV